MTSLIEKHSQNTCICKNTGSKDALIMRAAKYPEVQCLFTTTALNKQIVSADIRNAVMGLHGKNQPAHDRKKISRKHVIS